MVSSRLNPEFEIEVGGEPYVWWLQRRPAWSSEDNGMKGMALGARHAEGQRDVVLEFPPGPRPRFGAPLLKPEQIPKVLVAAAIASAVEAGWEPLSRGKTVVVVVDKAGG